MRFWALVALNLTVAARETYEVGTENVVEPTKLRAYNEILHRVCSYLANVEAADDQWLLSYVQERAAVSGIGESVEWAMRRAEETVGLAE